MTNAIEASLNLKLKDFFIKWLDITSSFHKLPNQQKQVLSLLLYHHYIIKKDVTNNKILWRLVFDYDTRMKIIDDPIFEGKMNTSALNTMLTSLRKKNIIVDGKISPRYIPVLTNDAKNFKIAFNFKLVDNE